MQTAAVAQLFPEFFVKDMLDRILGDRFYILLGILWTLSASQTEGHPDETRSSAQQRTYYEYYVDVVL
jgi:hypothetical protein